MHATDRPPRDPPLRAALPRQGLRHRRSTAPSSRTTTSATCCSTSPCCAACASASPSSTGPATRSAGSPSRPAARRRNLDGTGVTDAATLQLALTAANRVTHEILEGLSATDLRGAVQQRPRRPPGRHPAGRRSPVHRQGRARRYRPAAGAAGAATSSRSSRRSAATARGTRIRLNSDAVAVEVARALQAVKLIYLTTAARASARGSDGERAAAADRRRGRDAPARSTRGELPAGAASRSSTRRVRAAAGRRAARPHHRRPRRGGPARRGVLQRGHRHADPRQRVPGDPPGRRRRTCGRSTA